MKGDPQVIDALNLALTVELTAINQYFCQAKMCKNWGFMKLAAKHYEESMGEMKHADKLIDRILFLEGTPEIARYDVIRVGTDVAVTVWMAPLTTGVAMVVNVVPLMVPTSTVNLENGTLLRVALFWTATVTAPVAPDSWAAVWPDAQLIRRLV